MSIQRIPRLFFQTSKLPVNPRSVEMIKVMLSDEWTYRHFLDSDIIEYLKANPLEEFPNALQFFLSIKRGEHKADFFRYYFLYTEGGVFMDTDAMIYQPIDKILKDYTFVSVLPIQTSNGIFNGFIASEKKNPIIYEALLNIYNLSLSVLDKDYLYLCKELYSIYKRLGLNNCKLYNEIEYRKGDKIIHHINKIVDDSGNTLLKHFWNSKENIPYYLDNLRKYNTLKPGTRNLKCIYTKLDRESDLNSLYYLLCSIFFYMREDDYDVAVICDAEFYEEIQNFSVMFNEFIYTDILFNYEELREVNIGHILEDNIWSSPIRTVTCKNTFIKNLVSIPTLNINSIPSIVGNKYSWNSGYIIFVNETEINTAWGVGKYKIINNHVVYVIWSRFYHILSFNSNYTSFVSLLFNSLEYTKGCFIEKIPTVNLYIFGDSHGIVGFNNLKIPHRNLSEFSKTMFRVGRDNEIINFKQEYNNENSIFCLVYGEIDTRAHVGKQNKPFEQVCNELVSAYINAIRSNITKFKKIIITAIIPPTDQKDHIGCKIHIKDSIPFNGTNDERVKYTQYMNTILSYECFKNGFIFFNPYLPYTRSDGCLDYTYSDKCIHIEKNEQLLKQFTSICNE